MSALLFVESPLDPLRIRRHCYSAGLAFEKHRWLFPPIGNSDALISLFTFGYEPLREIYTDDKNTFKASVLEVPVAQFLDSGAIPVPALNFMLMCESGPNPPRIVDDLVASWQAPVYLVFSSAHIPPFEPRPRHTNMLIENILGRPWDGEKYPGWIPLSDAEMRRRAVWALGTKGFHRLYLVAGPPDTTALPPYVHQLFKKWDGLTKINEPEVDYRLFHGLVSHCDWILTSHGNVPGIVPFCFYSVRDLRSVMQSLCITDQHTVKEFDDISALNRAAGIKVKPRGGFTLSEIMPLEMTVGETELSLAWSNLDRLDELPVLSKLRHLDLDGTLIDDLSPLRKMHQLESLSLRYIQLADLQPLTSLPSLHYIALSRIPIAGLSQLRAMPALKTLNLDLLPIEDASPLSGCQQLKDLSLNRTSLKRLDEIAQIGSLERLSICSTSITDIRPLTSLLSLRELFMDGCALDDLTPLPEIGELTTFSLVGLDEPPLRLPDLSPLAAMQRLKSLQLYNTIFQELPLSLLVNTLEVLDISAFLTQNLHWLRNLNVRRELEIAQIPALDLNQLRELGNLEVLNVGGCTVGDLAWLKNLGRLQKLNLNVTEIANLEPLASLSNLQSLSLGGTLILLLTVPWLFYLV